MQLGSPIGTYLLTRSSRERASTRHTKVPSSPLLPPNIHRFGYPTRTVKSIVSSPSSSKEGRQTAKNDNTPKRYCLRPNQPTNLQEDRSPYSFDHLRFPHFSKACRVDSRKRNEPDTDYDPPSETSTPKSSDRSPSAISSQLSDALSTESFGLEYRRTPDSIMIDIAKFKQIG
ncbi:hypothetical protein B0J11DRAFT_512233 [Dendryphion nanum]|uniref:Uncharacterized protein n=1 Tax=Dendryphion nanum TaxID=256645 RepID=A0A9P9D254_9PLEO|nr:hypothetical protein B0J11DRAFT_512233 [Dendryphion nanum]